MGGRDGPLTERVMTRPRSTRATLGLLVLAAGLLFGSHVRAEEEAAKSDESTEELTKKTQNPVADLISVPFQSNFNFGAGPRHALLYVLNVQPVVPIKLTEDWNLITRTIVPIISQGSLAPGIDHVGGDSATSTRASSCRLRSPGRPVGLRRAREQPVVVRRLGVRAR